MRKNITHTTHVTAKKKRCEVIASALKPQHTHAGHTHTHAHTDWAHSLDPHLTTQTKPQTAVTTAARQHIYVLSVACNLFSELKFQLALWCCNVISTQCVLCSMTNNFCPYIQRANMEHKVLSHLSTCYRPIAALSCVAPNSITCYRVNNLRICISKLRSNQFYMVYIPHIMRMSKLKLISTLCTLKFEILSHLN